MGGHYRENKPIGPDYAGYLRGRPTPTYERTAKGVTRKKKEVSPTYVNLPRDVEQQLQGSYGYAYCADCNGVITNNRRKEHDNFHAVFTNRKDGNMSSVTWCDYGQHAFKANAPGSVHLDGEERDEDGQLRTISTDACVLHRPDKQPNPDAASTRVALTQQAAQELRDDTVPDHVHPFGM